MTAALTALAWLSGLGVGWGLGHRAGTNATRRHLHDALRDLHGPTILDPHTHRPYRQPKDDTPPEGPR